MNNMRPTRRQNKSKRGTFRRKYRGGSALEAVVASQKLKPVIINAQSKFIVATYWWGRGNLNKNYLRFTSPQIEEAKKAGKPYTYMCTGDIYDIIKDEILDEVEDEIEEEEGERRRLTKPEAAKILEKPEVKDKISKRTNERVAKLRTEGMVVQESIKFEEMIENWKKSLEKIGCNYLVQEYPDLAKPGGYQLAINMKPLFIIEALKVAQGRGILYIDGDMTINRYPDIFDMPYVDFMARGWNVDPRASIKYMKDVCFDPYIFETSGGTMFFAQTAMSGYLLNKWAKVSALPENAGKADDRILSLVFTVLREQIPLSSIQLPIEYLWLTDAYHFQDPKDIDEKRIYIEHPACLTAEEAAREQGAANSREPPHYEQVISNVYNCQQPGGIFYEYIFFYERRFVESFAPYLKYLRRAKNNAGKPFFNIVDFDDKYGPYNKIAYKNMEAANRVENVQEHKVVKLPQNTDIPTIIATLKKGSSVVLGDFRGQFIQGCDLIANNIATTKNALYQRDIKIDVTKPIYFNFENPVLIHLLMMCEKLEDLNVHFHQSFLFATRLRCLWTKTDR